MEEDVAGQRAAGIARKYSTCSECGRSLLRRAARAHEAGLLEGTHSQFSELCPDCERLDRQGETPVSPAADF